MAARVQYSHPQRGINKTVPMLRPPVNVGDVEAWFKAARKTIPEIPKNWYRPPPVMDLKYIMFELIDHATHERCAVIIERKASV